jgi:NTP pyrophosphatase (non-canonical NTP hydrolase)
MELRKICEDTSDMGMWELAHNFVFIKNREAWYRDFDQEISVLDLMREIIKKHGDPESFVDMRDEELGEALMDSLQFGTDDIDGVFATLYMALWGMSEVREWLKAYETHGLPTTMRPEVLERAVSTWGKEAQVDMAIEEMSELTKALLKERRATHYPGTQAAEKARQGIFEEMADVIIMLMQLLLIFGGRDTVQKALDEKMKRLAGRLEAAAKEAGAGAAQEVMQPAT